MIFSKDYFVSGRYDLWAKVGAPYDREGRVIPNLEPLGCSFTFWNYNLIEYVDGEPQWYDDPSPIRNTEIDWEMPGDFPEGALTTTFPHCPLLSWSNSRLSAWGGQRGGDSQGNVTIHAPLPFKQTAADGTFHQYTFVWYSGRDHPGHGRTPGYIEWYFDTGEELHEDRLVARWEGDSYGFDNIPCRCARLAMSAWFPPFRGGYGPSTCSTESWAGTPNWYKAEFTVKKVRYTPFEEGKKPNRDRWEGGTEHLLKLWDPALSPH